jgi:hypothetical protein
MGQNQAERIRVGDSCLTLRREPWDCAQLELEAAKLEHLSFRDEEEGRETLRAALSRAAGRFHHLAARLDTSERVSAGALHAEGFRLVDCVVHLSLALDRETAPAVVPGFELRMAGAEDAAAMGALAADAFSDPSASFNRYLNDPGFTNAQVRRVYDTWARSSIGGAGADSSLVIYEGDALVAFLTLKHTDAAGVARVPLNAVSMRVRGRGLYRWLVTAAAAQQRAHGGQRLDVTTQLQQLAVQRTWWQLGAVQTGSAYSFHRWLHRSLDFGGAARPNPVE